MVCPGLQHPGEDGKGGHLLHLNPEGEHFPEVHVVGLAAGGAVDLHAHVGGGGRVAHHVRLPRSEARANIGIKMLIRLWELAFLFRELGMEK